MKTQLLLLIFTMTISLQAHAWGRSKSTPLPPASQAVSAQAIRDLLTLADPNATLEDFKGTWKKTLNAQVTQSEHDTSGFVNEYGIVNIDLSQHTITIDSIHNSWLPEGQNEEPRITENNFLLSGNQVTRRPEVVGSSIVYSRDQGRLDCDSCRIEFWLEHKMSAKDFHTLLPDVKKLIRNSKQKEFVEKVQNTFTVSSLSNSYNGDYTVTVTCNLLANNNDRMICNIKSQGPFPVNVVMGFERVTTATTNQTTEN